jgi:predicted amidophosphoribosyltransferase
VRKTRSQVGLNASQRRRNVSGAFAINESAFERVGGKRILLIDDVITTGATIEACSKALLRGGAETVNVLAFARVVDPLKQPI